LWGKRFREFLTRNLKAIQIPFDPHQKQTGFRIRVVVRVQDVAVVLVEDLGNSGD
jgi:hypothetical protein